MMFILTTNHKENFDLGKEITIGDKFDDIVIRSNIDGRKEYTFLQAKLVDNKNDLINSKVLLGKQRISLSIKDFELQKYFISYLRINDQLKSSNDDKRDLDDESYLAKVIIFTNAGLDKKELEVNGIICDDSSTHGTPLSKTHEDAKTYKIIEPRDSLIQMFKLRDIKSDLEKIAEELAKYITTPNHRRESMALNNYHFNYYHMALIDEKVINRLGKLGKFTQNFINNEGLSERTKKLRNELIQSIKT